MVPLYARRILDVAGELFARDGYAAVSMAEIARQAEVSVASLYVHFPGKAAVVQGMVGDITAAPDLSVERFEQETDPVEKMRLGARIMRTLNERSWVAADVLRSARAVDDELGVLWREWQRRHEHAVRRRGRGPRRRRGREAVGEAAALDQRPAVCSDECGGLQRIAAFGIDVQVAFCSPGASLFVPGAVEDTQRALRWLYSHLDRVTELVFSLDTHRAFQIFHPAWWRDAEGRPPAPLSVITAADVRAGRWRTWGPQLLLGTDVHGSTLGIVGFGRMVALAGRSLGQRDVVEERLVLVAGIRLELAVRDVPLEEDPELHSAHFPSVVSGA